jgi:hypothetical protein
MNIVEENGGLRNTLAMESYDIGYEQLTDSQKQWIDQRVDQLGMCPKCGEKPTFRDASGTFYDSSAHHWKVGGKE